jgi:hypothetical protein
MVGKPLLDVAAYDIAPGGARLVMPMPTSGTRADNRPTQVTFLLNFVTNCDDACASVTAS